MNLKELAKKLELSQTTVSRALNGYPEVSDKTRQRVVEAARIHNYRPSSRAKALATGRSMSIGHVIPISAKHEMVNPVFSDFIAGAGETYAKNGYDMMLSVVYDEAEEKAYKDLAANRSVDGVIVHGPKTEEPRIALLQQLDIPFVVHGRASGEKTNYSWLDVNNRRAFERGTDFLVDLGHTKIALVNGNENMDFAVRRREGYLSTLRERGIYIDESLMRSDEMTEYFGYNSACEFLDRKEPATAFLVSSMITAIGIRRAVEDRGQKLGRDVSVITFDDELSYLSNGGDAPIFTALRSSVRDAGRACASILLDRIKSPFAKPETKLLEAQLVVGQTTGPAPKPQ